MKQSFRGTVRGRLIELVEDAGLPDGQPVSVSVEPLGHISSPADAASLEALRRAAGAWSGEDEELNLFLEWNREQRKRDRRAAE
jgi:hypothetical protein